MCTVLQIARSTFYYETSVSLEKEHQKAQAEQELKDEIWAIFHENRRVYGTRKLKKELENRREWMVSRRRIGRLMASLGIQSKYALPSYKPMVTPPNEAMYRNVLNRQFNPEAKNAVLVSDLTYVKVGGRWNYICFLLDLYNREIVGYSLGERKDAALVQRAFASVKGDVGAVKLFHTDRGSEFKNTGIDALLQTHQIERSLSQKGNPYDNAVAEATFKILKTELINGMRFDTLNQLALELFDYVNWYNHARLHSSLGYASPVTYRNAALKKVV